jgi:PTH1 family peptidyl-tRNA hydrolase
MNLSGEAIVDVLNFYKCDATTNLIVIYDDISMEPGRLRLRKKGSAGGHNGIKNIIAHLGMDTFPRIKVGVGAKPAGWDLADYVLSRFDSADRKLVDDSINRAVDAITTIISDDFDKAMNLYNS